MIPNIPPKMFKEALKQYRRDVPSVGTVSFDEAQDLLKQGRICRGWMDDDNEKMCFHIIKSTTQYPHKSLFSANTEKELFATTIFMGMESGIDLDDLFFEE